MSEISKPIILGPWQTWAALNEYGFPIANSIRRTKGECCHYNNINNPVEIVIQIKQPKMEWRWVVK